MTLPATEEEFFDAVVLGAGVGGLVAAARLVLDGYRPLVLERADRVGGRFSTIEQDGFRLPTGAVAIESTGPLPDIARAVGAPFELRAPSPPVRVRIGGHTLTAGTAALERPIKQLARRASERAERMSLGRGPISLAEWVRRYARMPAVPTLLQAMAAGLFTANADEVDAASFFGYFAENGGYKAFGFAPRGNAEIAEGIATAIEARGGIVRRGVTVIGLEVHDGRVAAVAIRDATGARTRVAARSVVSNLGPTATAALVRDDAFARQFADRVSGLKPTSMIAIAFSTRTELLPSVPGMLTFVGPSRLSCLANLSANCPELAPPGRTLYDAYGVPRPSLGGAFDEEHEVALLRAELGRTLPGFREAEVLAVKVMRGCEPAMRALSGRDVSNTTPLPNLVDVGDGVKPRHLLGTGACAESGLRGVDALRTELQRPVAEFVR